MKGTGSTCAKTANWGASAREAAGRLATVVNVIVIVILRAIVMVRVIAIVRVVVVVVVVPRRTPWRLVVSGVFSLRSSRHSRSRASSIAFVGAGH